MLRDLHRNREPSRLLLALGDIVATNKNRSDGHLDGAVKSRSQFQTPAGNWAKRDSNTGKILNVKADKGTFKGVRKER
jgi:hypothetical protein